MAMWADNVKFVKDIIDSKYQKIDSAVAEVNLKFKFKAWIHIAKHDHKKGSSTSGMSFKIFCFCVEEAFYAKVWSTIDNPNL